MDVKNKLRQAALNVSRHNQQGFAARADNKVRAGAKAFRDAGGGAYGLNSGASEKGADPVTVRQPGGDLVNLLRHPSFETLEQLFRVIPEASWFTSVSPTSPHRYPIGSWKVPSQQHLFVTDYQFTVYRFSGQDPGDFVPAESGRFSSIMGFDLDIDGKHTAALSFALQPQPIASIPSGFRPQRTAPARDRLGVVVPSPADDFTSATARGFAVSSGIGTALLPVRSNVYGPRNSPFTIHAPGGSTVNLTGAVFQRVTTPIPFVQARIAGFTLSRQQADVLIDRLRPR